MNEPATYEEIVRILCEADPKVAATIEGGMKRFGASGELRVDGKMFAFCSMGRLIVKLPREKVSAWVTDGRGQPCVMGQRTMREWMTIGPERQGEWLAVAMESKRYVSGEDAP